MDEHSYFVAFGVAQVTFLVALHLIVSNARSGYMYGKLMESVSALGGTLAKRYAPLPSSAAGVAAAAQGPHGAAPVPGANGQ